MIPIFPRDSRRSKGVASGSGVFLRRLVGKLGTPKLTQIFTYGKWLYPYRMQQHGASDLDQRCLKTRSSKDGCTFPPYIFAPTPKITPQLHFGGPFNSKPIIQIALWKSHVNGATKLNHYQGWKKSWCFQKNRKYRIFSIYIWFFAIFIQYIDLNSIIWYLAWL